MVVNAEQAARGALVYKNVCVACHEPSEYSTPDFRLKWNGRTVFDLFDLVATTMPDDNPGKLSRQEYADVVAYMMKLNGIPEGPSAFPTDADSLKKLKIVLPNR